MKSIFSKIIDNEISLEMTDYYTTVKVTRAKLSLHCIYIEFDTYSMTLTVCTQLNNVINIM